MKKTKVTILSMLTLLTLLGIPTYQAANDNVKVRVNLDSVSTEIKVVDLYDVFVDTIKVKSKQNIDAIYTVKKVGQDLQIIDSNGVVLGSGKSIEFRGDVTTTDKIGVKKSSSYVNYPDDLIVTLDKGKNIQVINKTNVETYLKGVLPKEMGVSAPLEALKAQATTARTLAIKRQGKYAQEGYDLRDDTSDQVYIGYDSRYFVPTSNIYKAVEQTKGKVIKYKGTLVDSIFSDNNGGRTADDSFVWSSGSKTPYYNSKVDEFDKVLHPTVVGWNQMEYSVKYTQKELYNTIINASKKYPAYFKGKYFVPEFSGISENINVEILETKNGFVTKSRLTDDKGKNYIVNNYANRWVYGLRSQQFSLSKQGVSDTNSLIVGTQKKPLDSFYVKCSDGKTILYKNDKIYAKDTNSTKLLSLGNAPISQNTEYIFNGTGYGHAIGMSQNGAMNRADNGQKYEQILKFYYDGIDIVNY